MATNSTKPTTERRSPYPPEHPRKRRRYYFDDTLDAHPPLRRLFPGKPTHEAMEAARQLAAQRGYPMPHLPPETGDSHESPDTQDPATAAASPTAANDTLRDQVVRNTAQSRTGKARKK